MADTPPPDPEVDTLSHSDNLKVLFEIMRGFAATAAVNKKYTEVLLAQIQSISRDCDTLAGECSLYTPSGEISPAFIESLHERYNGCKGRYQYPKISLFLVYPDLKTITNLASGYAQTGYFAVYPFLYLQYLIPAITAETDGVIFLSAGELDDRCGEWVRTIRHTNPYVPIMLLTNREELCNTNRMEHDWIDGTVCEEDATGDVIKKILNAFETVAIRRDEACSGERREGNAGSI